MAVVRGVREGEERREEKRWEERRVEAGLASWKTPAWKTPVFIAVFFGVFQMKNTGKVRCFSNFVEIFFFVDFFDKCARWSFKYTIRYLIMNILLFYIFILIYFDVYHIIVHQGWQVEKHRLEKHRLLLRCFLVFFKWILINTGKVRCFSNFFDIFG